MGISWRLDARGRFHVTICRSLHEGRARRKRPGDRNLSEKPGNRRFKRSQCSGTGKEKILRNGGALRLVAACRPNPDQGRRFSVLKFSTCVGAAGSGAPMIRRAPSDRKSRSERRRATQAAIGSSMGGQNRPKLSATALLVIRPR